MFEGEIKGFSGGNFKELDHLVVGGFDNSDDI